MTKLQARDRVSVDGIHGTVMDVRKSFITVECDDGTTIIVKRKLVQKETNQHKDDLL
jgi:preprotein translocase subunit YajC